MKTYISFDVNIFSTRQDILQYFDVSSRGSQMDCFHSSLRDSMSIGVQCDQGQKLDRVNDRMKNDGKKKRKKEEKKMKRKMKRLKKVTKSFKVTDLVRHV